ncbi:MAG: hypothetical protein PHQ27_07145, partial [Victivallales bacterium]|nr:hypothetical protein [Victivallales bacterium]
MAFFWCALIVAAPPDGFPYISCGTFEYSGAVHNFRVQNAGIIDIARQQLPSGEYGYAITGNTALTIGDNQAAAAIESPPLLLLRDARNRALIGGFDCLKEFGTVADRALTQSSAKIIADNRRRHYEVAMDTTAYYPSRPGFTVKYTAVTSKTLGSCLLVTAVSDFFVCAIPGEKKPLTGIYKQVMLCDPGMYNLYFRCSGYEARMGDEQVNVKDNFWLGDSKTGEPVDLTDVRSELDRELASIYMPDKGKLETDSTPPPWAVHALSVKRYLDVTCGAVVEGQPNIAVIMAVGGFLLIDSAVSTGSELLASGIKKLTGRDIYVYPGATNYLGQGIGWGGATVYETVTGNKADTAGWKSIGGDLADIAAMFLSPGAAAKGFKAAGKGLRWGVKLVDARKYDKIIRIGKYAMSFATAEKLGKAFNLKSGIQKIMKGWNAWWGTGGAAPGNSGGYGGSDAFRSGVPGGLLFAMDDDELKITTAVWQASRRQVLFNGKLAYTPLVSPEEMAIILRFVAARDGFGFSLAAKIKGQIGKDQPFYRTMSVCDHYLGNIVFGRLDRLPDGCKPAPDYVPAPLPDEDPGAVCAIFRFRYHFETEGNNYQCRGISLTAAAIPYVREETGKPGKYEYTAATTEYDRELLAAYQHNAAQFDAKYYLQQPVVTKVTALGEAAMIALKLKQNGVDIDKLAATITAAATPA